MPSHLLVFSIPKDKILNSNRKLHHFVHGSIVKHLRTLSAEEGLLASEGEVGIFDKFRIVVTVCPPTRRRLDPANLWPTVKALVDGLTDANWWEDDDFKHLLEISFRYGGLSGEKDVFKLKMLVEEISDHSLYQLEAELSTQG